MIVKKIAQRLAFGRTSWDPVAYWRERAKDPATQSVMWQNTVYNALVDRDEWDVVREALPPRRGSVLDLGCGTGRMSARLGALFDEYTGVDLDTMVEEARRRNPNLAERYVAATVESYEYPEERFDCVLSLGCLATACTKESLPGVAKRIVGSIRTGGHLIVVEPFHAGRLLTRGCRLSLRDVARLFEDDGMRVETESGMLFFPARFLLSERVFANFPRLTEGIYRTGELLTRRYPEYVSDYGIIVLSKRR